jgi:hypothetical protein
LLVVSALATTSPAAELKWRSGRMAINKVSPPPERATAEQQFMRPRAPSQHRETPAKTESAARAQATGTKKTHTPARSNPKATADPWTSDTASTQPDTHPKSEPSLKEKWRTSAAHAPKNDPDLRQAAFEDDGPQLTSGDEGRTRLRSVVVDQEELDFTRSAQLPATGADASQPDTTLPPATINQSEIDSQLEQDLRLPFGTPDGPDQGAQQPDTMRQPTDDQPGPLDDTQLPTDTTPDTFTPDFTPGGEATQPTDEDVPIASPAEIEEDRIVSDTACNDSLTKLRAKTIGTVNISIAVSGNEGIDFPFECTFEENQWHSGRAWDQTTFLWKASALCHKPLYFEDPQLERYGHSFPPCCQPLISGAHFFTRLPVLPYCMGVEPPMECVYSLGHYRPGSCSPYMFEPIPISYRGALFQAGAVVGAAAALP